MPVSTHKRALPKQLVMQILERPHLVAEVRQLSAEQLGRLIREVGLEDAGELVALASSAQLEALLDADVWRAEEVGVDEAFDADRLMLWLEVMLDADVETTLRRVSELDEDVLTLTLCRSAFVIDVEGLAQRMSAGELEEDADLMLKEVEGGLFQDFEQYRVISRNARTWETLRALLVELDSRHGDLFLRLLERGCFVSNEYIEDNGGLYEVLSSDAQAEVDAAAARDVRRTDKGFVTPSDAAAFLRDALRRSTGALVEEQGRDPITHAYFRDAKAPVQPAREHARYDAPLAALLHEGDAPRVFATRKQPRLVQAMQALRERDDARYGASMHELGYLANVLLAIDAASPEPRRPVELAESVLALCERGARTIVEDPGVASIASMIATHGLVKLFRIGLREHARRADVQPELAWLARVQRKLLTAKM